MSTTDTVSVPEIQVNFDKLHDIEKFVFRFKKDKVLGNRRPNVELEVPVPSVEGIVEILTKGGKGLELLRDAMAEVIRDQLALFVSENEKVTQASIPLNQFTWDAIANIDKKDRRTTAISDELWAEFGLDYLAVMERVTNKEVRLLNNHMTVYMAKFAQFKTDKRTLEMMKGQLAIYMEHTKSEDQFSDILELLTRRLTNYLAADDIAALANAL